MEGWDNMQRRNIKDEEYFDTEFWKGENVFF
jgi:hypothetical protein